MTDEQTDRELMRALLDGETLIGPDGIRLRLGDDDMLETRRMGTNPDWTKRPRMLSAGKISWSTLKRSRGRASSRYRRVVFGELTTSEKALSYSYLLDERDSGYVATVVEWPSISAGGESRRAALEACLQTVERAIVECEACDAQFPTPFDHYDW